MLMLQAPGYAIHYYEVYTRTFENYVLLPPEEFLSTWRLLYLLSMAYKRTGVANDY